MGTIWRVIAFGGKTRWHKPTARTATRLYAYDGLYQLLDLSRGQLNDDETAINSGTLNFAQAWELDPTGNWTDYKEDDTGGGFTFYETRAANAVNEITALTTTDPAWVTPAYDDNGNMTTMPQPAAPSSSYTAVYDAWNRLVGLMDGDEIVAGYAYDGLGRRTTKDIGGTIRDYYYSDSWQILEEQLSGSTERQFVWGLRYVNDLVLRDRDPDGSGTLSERIYPLQDANCNVTALVDDTGAVLERYLYSAYGVLTVLNPDFSVKGGSPSYDWETLYASYRWHGESGLYIARYRDLHAPLGVWITRDLIGSAGDAWNPYRYVMNCPITMTDPSGLIRQIFAFEGRGGFPNVPEGENTTPTYNPDGTLKITWGTGEEDFQSTRSQVLNYVYPAVQAAGGNSSWHYYSRYAISKAVKDIGTIARRPRGEFTYNQDYEGCYKYDTIILIGYSYGGYAAYMVAQKLASEHVKVDLVITIDPVSQKENGRFAKRKTQNVSAWVNWYQENLDPIISGQSVEGADFETPLRNALDFAPNQIPKELAGNLTATPHVTIPGLPQIAKDVTARIQRVPELRDSYRFGVLKQ